jgi:prophage DNA circulation protein
MADYPDKLLPGSFRGVAFKVEAHDEQLGRRFQIHQYPGRDTPYVEDLGQEAGVWSLELFVIGPNYFADRDALRDALTKPGPGELIHPYLGRKQVAVTDASMRETMDEGGMARFRCEFTQSAAPTYPTATTQTWAIVRGKVIAAETVVNQSFATRAETWLDKASVWARQAAGYLSGGLQVLIVDVAGQYLPVGTLLGTITSLSQAGLGLQSLIASPANFSAGLSGWMGNFVSLSESAFGTGGDDRDKSLAAYAALAAAGSGFGLEPIAAAIYASPNDPVPAVRAAVLSGVSVYIAAINLRVLGGETLSADRALLLALAAEILILNRRLALIAEAYAASKMTWDSYQAAIIYRTSIADRLEAEADTAADDVCAALRELRLATIQDLTARAADLRRLDSYTPLRTQPVCVLGFRLYGDAAMGDDLRARNRIPHPAFAPGGVVLEVLSV